MEIINELTEHLKEYGGENDHLIRYNLLDRIIKYIPTHNFPLELRDAIKAVKQPSLDLGQKDSPTARTLARPVSEPWVELQKGIRGTVIQLISFTQRFNFLEPYKKTRTGSSSGSAFFIDDEGYIISNYHVVQQTIKLFAKVPGFGQQEFKVDVVGVSPERDIALLKMSKEVRRPIEGMYGVQNYLKMGDSDKVLRSQQVMAIGFPLGQDKLKTTLGIVSGRQRLGYYGFIQIDTPINPGNSGGPAINIEGKVIGINSRGVMGAENIGYIIPINEVKLIIDSLKRHRVVRQPSLGVVFVKPTKALVEYSRNPTPGGWYIAKVFKTSPLHKLGVREGDMLYSINGHKVDIHGEVKTEWAEDKISVFELLNRYDIGRKINITVYRNGSVLKAARAFTFSQLKMPIRRIYSEFEKHELNYLPIGGMILMNLRINHVRILINLGLATFPVLKSAEQENRDKSVVVITKIFPNSEVMDSDVLNVGTIIAEVNGKAVGTINQFAEALKGSRRDGFVKLKSKQKFFTVLSLKRILEGEKELAKMYGYTQKVFDRSRGGKIDFEIKL